MSVALPIEKDTRFRRYTASAGQKVFSIPFPFQQDHDVEVLAYENGLYSPIDRSLYTVSGSNSSVGGTITFKVSQPVNAVFAVIGRAVLERLSSVVRDGRFSSKLIDDELDRNRIIQQEQQRDIDRSLKLAFGTSFSFIQSPEIGRSLLWKKDGTQWTIENGPDVWGEVERLNAAISLINQAGDIAEHFYESNIAASMAKVKPTFGTLLTGGGMKSGDGRGGVYVDKDNGSSDKFVADGREWYRAFGTGFDFDVIYTVGSSGDFPNINSALNALSLIQGPRYVKGGIKAELRLLSGFIIEEQVIVDGIDLGWITITSEDIIVLVNPDAIVERLSPLDMGNPVFGGRNGAVLPRYGILIKPLSPPVLNIMGIGLFWGSHIEIMPECGAVGGWNSGIRVFHGSSAGCMISGIRNGGIDIDTRGPNFSDAWGRGVEVQHGSRINFPRLDADGCGAGGADSVYIAWDSRANLYQARARNALAPVDSSNWASIRSRDGSTVNARESDVSGALSHGYYASHGSKINARQLPDSPNGYEGANNCGQIGVWAEASSEIDASLMQANHCTVGFRASATGTIHAVSSSAEWSSEAGYQASATSRINARTSKANNSPVGFKADLTSEIEAEGSQANDCTTIGVYAYKSSNINFDGGSLLRCGQGAVASRISKINVTNAVFTGCVTNSCHASRGSTIEAQGATGQRGKSSDPMDLVVVGGSFIHCSEYPNGGGTSQPVNTVTADGIIFR